ncbi:phosphatase PAP2 family protein [bacterium]|nr:phosphatase PAP2 family protein [bacterium]
MSRRHTGSFLGILLVMLPAFSGTRYRTGPEKEIPVVFGALALTGAAFQAQSNIRPPDTLKLNRGSIFLPDRWAAGLENPFLARLSDGTAAGSLILPLIAFSQVSRKELPDGLAVYLEALVLTRAAVYLCKGVFQRPRPYAYSPGRRSSVSLDRDAAQSFFSGHTAVAFCGAVFATRMARTRMVPEGWRDPLLHAGLAMCIGTACLRVASGKHFPTDVLAGAAAGSLIGWSLSRMHETGVGESSGMPPLPVLQMQIRF